MSRYNYEIWDGENKVEADADENYFSIDVDPVEMKKQGFEAAIVKLTTVVEAMRLQGFYIKCPKGFEAKHGEIK